MIDELRKKRLKEMEDKMIAEQNKSVQKQLEEQQKMQQQIELIENVAKQFLSKDALERYGRVRMAHAETAIRAATLIAQAAQLGQLTEPLNDKEFKELLRRMQEGKREFHFKR